MQLATATLDEVVDKFGPLAEIAPKFERGTEWSAQQHINARRTEPDSKKREALRNRWYWTNDSALYPIEKGKSVVYLGRGDLILDNILEATSQLRQNNNYRPGEEIAYAFKRAPTTVRAGLDDLGLKRHDDEFSYLVIKTLKGRDGLNPIQLIIAERPYGQAEDFEDNMKMLRDAGINETRVWILNPDYIKEMNKQGPIARVSGLDRFGNDSGFDAGVRNVDDPYGGLRGGLKKSAEGAAPKIDPATVSYTNLLKNTELAVQVMRDNPHYQQEIANILAKSLQK